MNKEAYFVISYDSSIKKEIKQNEKEIISFLAKEGFKSQKTYWGCPWLFVDIVNKVFIPGRPGISYGLEIGGHAITFDEFKTIYEIYKKYHGLPILKMRKELSEMTTEEKIQLALNIAEERDWGHPSNKANVIAIIKGAIKDENCLDAVELLIKDPKASAYALSLTACDLDYLD